MSSNRALSAKARALYGLHLSKSNYQELVVLTNVQSVAQYLQTKKRYQVVLSDLLDKDIHRDTLEARVRKMVYWEFKSLLRYKQNREPRFYTYFLAKQEMQLLLYVANALLGNLSFNLPQYYLDIDALLDINVKKISEFESYDSLVAYLDTTKYKGLLNIGFSILEVEHALSNFYQNNLLGVCSELSVLMSMDIELLMVEKIYRLKKYYHQSHMEILSVLDYVVCLIPRKQMIFWIDNYDSEEFLQAFKESKYKKYLSGVSFDSIERALNLVRYRWFVHKLRFSNSSDVVFAAYMELVQFEMKNLIDVIEGVRYALPQDEILNLLIL